MTNCQTGMRVSTLISFDESHCLHQVLNRFSRLFDFIFLVLCLDAKNQRSRLLINMDKYYGSFSFPHTKPFAGQVIPYCYRKWRSLGVGLAQRCPRTKRTLIYCNISQRPVLDTNKLGALERPSNNLVEHLKMEFSRAIGKQLFTWKCRASLTLP